MTTFTGTDKLAASLWRIRSDLSSHTSARLVPERFEHYRIIAARGGRSWFETAETVLALANAVIRQPRETASPPARRITRDALAASRQFSAGLLKVIDVADEFESVPCLKAEPRVLASLRRHADGSKVDDHRPAAVVIPDIDDEPFAYEKNMGQKVAYAWRSGVIETRNGLRWIPGDSFFDMNYRRHENPAWRYMGAGLIRLSDWPPDEVNLLRYSTAYFSPDLANDVTQLASLEDTGLPYVREPYTLGFDRDDIARQVASLLQQGAAPSVRP